MSPILFHHLNVRLVAPNIPEPQVDFDFALENDASQLFIGADRHDVASNVSFALCRGRSKVACVIDSDEQGGIAISATNLLEADITNETWPATVPYMSFRTTRDKEQMRIDNNGFHCGILSADTYTNLTSSYNDANLFRPPSEYALNEAYISLSNLITNKTSDVILKEFVGNSASLFSHLGSNVGINLPNGVNPMYTLHVNGAVYASEQMFALSDRRAKSNIERIDNALDKVGRIGGYTFTMNGRACVGVIAQEVQQTIPEAVSVQTNGMLSVSYNSLVGVLFEAMREMRNEVGELKKQLDDMRLFLYSGGGGQQTASTSSRVMPQSEPNRMTCEATTVGSGEAADLYARSSVSQSTYSRVC